MKSNITLLCLSDLHIENESGKSERNQDPLWKLFVGLKKCMVTDQKWKPDYIVIAGDIVHKPNAANYKFAEDKIKKLANEFNIPSHRVISIPGNHDKTIAEEVHDYDGEDECLKKLCEIQEEKGSHDNNKKKFINQLKNSFKEYSDFNKNFLPEDSQEATEEYISDFSDDDVLCSVEGLRIYDKHKIAFICLNTEWCYRKGDKHYNPALCRPSIRRMCEILSKKEYSDYLVITLMHRNFQSLSWNDINQPNGILYDSYREIRRHSSIIFTGHDHPVNTLISAYPDYIGNATQLIKLGTPNAKNHPNGDYKKIATLVNIDSACLEMELAHGEYDSGRGWTFNSTGVFPLRNKYARHTQREKSAKKHYDWAMNIRAKADTEKETREAIEAHIGWRSGGSARKLDVWPLDGKSWDTLPRLSVGEFLQVVLYEISRPGDNISDVAERFREKRRSLKLEENQDVLLGRLVVSFALIAVPDSIPVHSGN